MFPLITQFICLVAFFVLSLTTPARYLVSIPTTVVLLPYLAYLAYYYGGKDANERKDASRRKAAFFLFKSMQDQQEPGLGDCAQQVRGSFLFSCS